MISLNSRIKTLFNYLTSSLISSVFSLILVVLISGKVSTADFAKYSILLFLVQFVSKMVLVGMDSAVLRFYRGDANRALYFHNALVIISASTVLSAIIFFALKNLVIYRIVDIDISLSIIVFVAGVFEALYQFYLSHLVSSSLSKRYRVVVIVKISLQSLLIVTCLLLKFPISTFFLCNSAAALFIFVGFRKEYAGFITGEKADKTVVRDLLFYGGPLVFYAIFSNVSDYASRIFMSAKDNTSDLASFHFFLQIVMFGQGLIAMLYKSWGPYAMDHILNKNTDFPFSIKRVSNLFLIGISGSLLVLLIMYKLELFSVFLKKDYLDNIIYLFLLIPSLSFIFLYMVISPYFYVRKNTVRLSTANVIYSTINIFLSYFLASRYGAFGAAVAFVTINGFALILFPLFFRKEKSFEIIVWPVIFTLLEVACIVVYILFYPHLFFVIALIGLIALFLSIKEIRYLKFYSQFLK